MILCALDGHLSVLYAVVIFTLTHNFQLAQPFFKFMSMLVEFVGGPPGMPPFTQYILQRYWDVSWTIFKYLYYITFSNSFLAFLCLPIYFSGLFVFNVCGQPSLHSVQESLCYCIFDINLFWIERYNIMPPLTLN